MLDLRARNVWKLIGVRSIQVQSRRLSLEQHLVVPDRDRAQLAGILEHEAYGSLAHSRKAGVEVIVQANQSARLGNRHAERKIRMGLLIGMPAVDVTERI